MEVKKERIGAYAIIIKDEKIALVRKKGGGYAGKLDLPGGGIKHLETPVAALKREVLEEIGQEVLNYELFDIASTNIKWKMEKDLIEDLHHLGVLYRVSIKNYNIKSEPDGFDTLGSNWYSIKELKEDELTPFAKYSLLKLGYKIS